MNMQFKKIMVFLLATLFIAPAFVGCKDDDLGVVENRDKQGVVKKEDIMTLNQVFQQQLADIVKKLELLQQEQAKLKNLDPKTRYVHNTINAGEWDKLNDALKEIADDYAVFVADYEPVIISNKSDIATIKSSITAIQGLVASNSTAITELKTKQTELETQINDLETALKNAVGAADVADLEAKIKAMYDRVNKLSDDYIKGLVKDVLETFKVQEEHLNDLDWVAVIQNQWNDNNGKGNEGDVINAIMNLQFSWMGTNRSLDNMLDFLWTDMYSSSGDPDDFDPTTAGLYAKGMWLYQNYNGKFLEALENELGLSYNESGSILTPNSGHKFETIVDVFNQLKVISTKAGEDHTSLLIHALLADLGQVVGSSTADAKFEKWDEYKTNILTLVQKYKPTSSGPDNEYKAEWDAYVTALGHEPTADDIWTNLEFFTRIAHATNLKARRMWAGLEMRKKTKYHPVTLAPLGDEPQNSDGTFDYESKPVVENWLDIQRLKKQVEIINDNINNVYSTIGGWVSEITFVPNYVNDKKVPYVPFRYIRDEENAVSGYFNLVYDISPSNARLFTDYQVESVEIAATPQTRAAAGAIHFVSVKDLGNQRILVKVYVENITALEGKNVGFMLKIRNTNANLKVYDEATNSFKTVIDPEKRIVKSAVVYGEVTENEVGVASHKNEIDIDQRFIVRNVGESDADALARAKASDSYIEFISTDAYSFDLADRLFPYVYDSKQEISLIELGNSPYSHSKTYRKEQFINYKLVKAELLKGEDGKYLELNGTVLKRKPIVGGADLSFGKFQYVKLTYTFNGYKVSFDDEGSVTRVAYIKLKMTNPAVTAVKEFSFTTEYEANISTSRTLRDDVDFYTAMGFDRAGFLAIYGRPSITTSSSLRFTYDSDNQPRVRYSESTPVGTYQAVYTYKAAGYPDVVMTWNVNLVLPELKVGQTAVELPIKKSASDWQYQSLKQLFKLRDGDINFNGEVDDYFFTITRLPSGFRVAESGTGWVILRSNAEIGVIKDQAATFDGKKITLVGGAKAEFWQSVRRIGGMEMQLVAKRGVHETVVAQNVTVNFSYHMTYDRSPGSITFNNNVLGTQTKDLTSHFNSTGIKWNGWTAADSWYGITAKPVFTGKAYLKNSAGEYDLLPKRYMDQLTISDKKVSWKGKQVPMPNGKLEIYLPVEVKHAYGTYSEYYILTVKD